MVQRITLIVVVPNGCGSTNRPALSADRKMCVVVPHLLARGPAPSLSALRAPVASPRPWLGMGVEPKPSLQNVSPFHHSQGDFTLPAPIDLGGVPAPKTPDHFMETTSSRPGKRALHSYPSHGPIPSTMGHVMPLGTPTRRKTSLSLHGPPIDQACAAWICASVSMLDPIIATSYHIRA